MPITRNLLKGPITYSEAAGKETNILHELTYVASAAKFRNHIDQNRAAIKEIVAHHLRLAWTSCQIDVSALSEWRDGNFNLCVPVSVRARGASTRFMMRFPLPYKTGDSFRPGNSDEKIRCEAATYAWIEQECLSIPVPCLRGFGLSTGQRVRQGIQPSVFYAYSASKDRYLSLLRYPVPCHYLRDWTSPQPELGVGYLLLDYVEDGKSLHDLYLGGIHDKTLKHNLFSDLARIQLTFFQKPLPRIGSLTVDDTAVIHLTNRPLTSELHWLENQKIPTDIPRNRTYSTVENYARDLLLAHDNRLLYQPNGVTGPGDGIGQMAPLSAMKAIGSEFFNRKLQRGPFVLTPTYMHSGNFFVDENWHITKVIDLQFACGRPVGMHHPPLWLSNQYVDTMDEQYGQMYSDYVDVFEQQEEKMLRQGLLQRSENGSFYTDLFRKLWETGTFWYCLALHSPTGICQVFNKHLKPKYLGPEPPEFDTRFYVINSHFWCIGSWDLLRSKVKDKEQYDEELRRAFEVSDD